MVALVPQVRRAQLAFKDSMVRLEAQVKLVQLVKLVNKVKPVLLENKV